MDCKPESVYHELRNERHYQVIVKGYDADFDDMNTERDWMDFITEYNSGISSRTKDKPFRKRMLKVAALAIAAIESHDRQAEKENCAA